MEVQSTPNVVASTPTILLLLAGSGVVSAFERGLDALSVPARLHRRVADDPFDAVQVPPAPWHAAVELEGEPPLDALRGLLGAAHPEDSVAVAGIRHDIVVESGPVRMVYCMRRRPDLTVDAFQAYWATQHAAIAVGDPDRRNRSYRQLHADPARSAEVARALGLRGSGFDGVALSDMASLAELPLVAARGDRENFVAADGEVGLFVQLVHATG